MSGLSKVGGEGTRSDVQGLFLLNIQLTHPDCSHFQLGFQKQEEIIRNIQGGFSPGVLWQTHIQEKSISYWKQFLTDLCRWTPSSRLKRYIGLGEGISGKGLYTFYTFKSTIASCLPNTPLRFVFRNNFFYSCFSSFIYSYSLT